MISRTEFQLIDNVEKMALLFDQGREVMSRIYMYYNIKLYSLNDFFVEVWYRQSSNTVDKIEVADMDRVFHLYEKSIDISDLFN
ncbi:MAG: hypothetical protein C0593_04335 [Marinilabiliales bacterium]|jgi:hypothetical protein|nr:MAG: hypothetical protein C0593_04335 [Marinilabiliales bacterium]